MARWFSGSLVSVTEGTERSVRGGCVCVCGGGQILSDGSVEGVVGRGWSAGIEGGRTTWVLLIIFFGI